MATELYPLNDKCPACGTRHIETPCRKPCACKCRKCETRLRHKHPK